VNTFLSSLARYKKFSNKDADMDLHEIEIIRLVDKPIQDYEPYVEASPSRLEHQ
jgi:hypothetical protein